MRGPWALRRGWQPGGMLLHGPSRARWTQCALCHRSTCLLTTWVIEVFVIVRALPYTARLLLFPEACKLDALQLLMLLGNS